MISKVSKAISLLIIIVAMVSCNSEESIKVNSDTKKVEKSELSYKSDKTKLEWRAFKTTAKLAVKGTFNEIEISGGKGATVEDIILSTSFKINTTSVFTGNEGRDLLLKKFFFGAMLNSEIIEGSFVSAKDGKGIVSIKMNGIEYNNEFDYKFINDSLKISTIVLIDNWNGQKPLESLHEKCADKHTGADGVSKTWSDVEVDITTVIK